MKFQVIVADPPWSPSDSLSMSSVKRGAAANYPVLSVDQICELPVKKVADPDGCVLALWVLGSMLEDGLRVMKAWGFEQKQVYVWVKTKKQSSINSLAFKDTFAEIRAWKRDPIAFINTLLKSSFKVGDWLLSFGMGRLFRQSHEICFIGINNTKIYSKLENKSQRSVCFEENKGHSIKPDYLQGSLETMFPQAKRLEMFARRQHQGWTVIGHDVSNGEDIFQSLNTLKDNDDNDK
jgi:N6-adenosine-specific RNA methylase IME4